MVEVLEGLSYCVERERPASTGPTDHDVDWSAGKAQLLDHRALLATE